MDGADRTRRRLRRADEPLLNRPPVRLTCEPGHPPGVDQPAVGTHPPRLPAATGTPLPRVVLIARAAHHHRSLGRRSVPANPPQRYILAVAHQPGPDPLIQRGADGGRDFFSEVELEKAAWRFLDGPREIGTRHADGTVGVARVTESYIYRGPDWPQADGSVIRKGTWLIGMVCDEPTWEAVEKGEFTGVSVQGAARRRKPALALAA